MVPALVIEGGKPVRSYCPFCAAVHCDFSASAQVNGVPGKVVEVVAGGVGASVLGAILGAFISF